MSQVSYLEGAPGWADLRPDQQKRAEQIFSSWYGEKRNLWGPTWKAARRAIAHVRNNWP